MLKNRHFIFVCYVGIILCVCISILSTYAYLTVDTGEIEEDITIKTYNKDISIDFIDTSNVSLVNAYTGQKIVKTFDIKNKSDFVVYYDLLFSDVVNDFEDKNDLVYTVKSNNGGANISERVLPSEDASIASHVSILPGVTQTYEISISFIKDETDQSDNMNKTFFTSIKVDSSKIINSGENIYNVDELGYALSNNVIGDNYSEDFNNKVDGVYYTNDSINGNTIYFYRGNNNLNNNVVFAGYCFKMIRTTENYGIKLIYNGKYSDGVCDNEGVIDSKSTFNDLSNYNGYVGFMYGNVSSDVYLQEHLNNYSSTIKGFLDVWYNNNIKDYDEFIDNDAVYCSNRQTSKFKYAGVLYDNFGYGNLNTGYKLMNDYIINNNFIDYNCDVNDRLSANNKLNYSIGLISIDELYMAGFVPNINKRSKNYKKENLDNYLYTSKPYYTMTPAYYNGSDAYNFVINGNTVIEDKVSNLYYVRPVITLKRHTKFISGDGSINNPYVINVVKGETNNAS